MNKAKKTMISSTYSIFYTKTLSLIRLSLIFLIYFLNFIYSQTYQDIKRLQAEYEKRLEENEEGLDNKMMPPQTTQSTKIIYKPSDINSYYKEELNRFIDNLNDIDEINKYLDSTKSLDYFGYDFFSKRDSSSFWETIPLPSNYQLGSGDELIIYLWGEVERIEQKVINRDGSVFIEDIGIIPLSGKTLLESHKIIKSFFEKTYSTLKGTNPKSFINVSLGQLKGLNIHFYGSVKQPGIHALHPFSTIITGLIQAGGIDTTGSLRNIKLIRNNKVIHNLDLYSTLTRGYLENDIKLLNQDVIFVSNRLSTVAINGEIYRPGYFELKPKENLKNLIEFSGGTKPFAHNKVLLNRIDKSNNELNVENYQIDSNVLNNYEIINGDSVFIPKILSFNKTITVSGQVLEPGDYTFTNNMRVLDALFLAGGFNDSIWWKSIDLEESLIIRQNNDGSFEKINFNLKKLLVGNSSENLLLEPFDRLLIPKNKKFVFGEFITITGEVIAPGSYLVNNNSVNDVINSAGGYTPRAFKDGVQIYRDSMKIAWTDLDIFIAPNDSIYVPPKTNLVKIIGAVNNEGFYPFNKRYSLSDYIENAGGFTVYANRKDVVVILPNGVAKRKRRLSNPKVLLGSTIIVSGSDLVVAQPDYLAISSQVASIIGSLATVALIISSQNP